MLEVYSAWIKNRPDEAKNDDGYDPQDGNDDVEVNSDTNSQQTRPLRSNHRKRSCPEGSPSQNRRHQARRELQEESLSVPLSDRTLMVHQRKTGKRKWCPESVKVWSQAVNETSVENTDNTELVSKRQKI